MGTALSVKNLRIRYGAIEAVKGIDIDVPEGSVVALLGANGAGKTTTMNMALGFLEIDSGEIIACGEKVSYGKTIKNIGYLPDVPEFYNYMRPSEYLLLCGELSGMPKPKIKERSRELLELVGLSKANRKIGGFSRGMKQRLGIAQALLNSPKLLICDEPTSALDPKGRKEILDILQQVKGETTVIFSTHILSDVERICDHIAVIDKGRIVLESAMSELKYQCKSKTITLEFEDEVDSAEVLRVLAESNFTPSRVETAEISIENVYMEVVK
jgi:ABC-2 type transport system ATP-binding protein